MSDPQLARYPLFDALFSDILAGPTPRRIPPLAPYVYGGTTRIGSFRTFTFHFRGIDSIAA